MLNRIAQTIADHVLLPDGEPVLAAVSGGADSIFLLHALNRLAPRYGWKITVAHLNHGLRGRGAEADAEFVGSVARGMNLDCIVGETDVRSLAAEAKISIEMAGRLARRDFFARTANDLGIAQVATGHTADDRVETLLLTMARGAGMESLASIPYRSPLNEHILLVRPLLDLGRRELEIWLRQNGLAWREDPENHELAYRRNRVRHELLPWLETNLNPRVRQALLRLARQAELDKQWTGTMTEETLNKCLVFTPAFANEPAKRPPALAIDRLQIHPAALRHRVLARWLYIIGLPAARIDAVTIHRLDRMLVEQHPSAITLAAGMQLVLTDNTLSVVADSSNTIAPDAIWTLPEELEGRLTIAELGVTVTLTRESGPFGRQGGKSPGRLPAESVIRLPRPDEDGLALRCRRPGDRMHPTGSGGSRKIQDILIDAGVPQAQRSRIPLLVCGASVVWLPGYRISRDWRITDPGVPYLKIRIERESGR